MFSVEWRELFLTFRLQLAYSIFNVFPILIYVYKFIEICWHLSFGMWQVLHGPSFVERENPTHTYSIKHEEFLPSCSFSNSSLGEFVRQHSDRLHFVKLCVVKIQFGYVISSLLSLAWRHVIYLVNCSLCLLYDDLFILSIKHCHNTPLAVWAGNERLSRLNALKVIFIGKRRIIQESFTILNHTFSHKKKKHLHDLCSPGTVLLV